VKGADVYSWLWVVMVRNCDTIAPVRGCRAGEGPAQPAWDPPKPQICPKSVLPSLSRSLHATHTRSDIPCSPFFK
jgi:hypothetical protein